ncbi:universal stress protein [Roseovarius sp. LXJ103]|uniref:universal stress protein n=1 Tax=Roseovarius carneus TaxID=2853164 RepID=UPI000D60F2EE|nr:universal stress protein [Roseovarius carneus]MBZ8117353.1 universal stress protein [Roseovarius carneus]PWE36828.1 universal stress protein [Pelagicola sp. LXJ1103]
MAYKTLITVLTDATLVAPTLAEAEALAARSDAHLEVLCLGVDRSQAGFYYGGASAMLMEQSMARAQGEANEVESAVRAYLKTSTIRWSCEADVAQITDIPHRVGLRTRFADVAVLPRPYGKDRGSELEAVAEACLFNGSVPTLIVPADADASQTVVPKRILVGWNESPEAMSAIRAALPMMLEADKVHVVVVDPPAHGPNRSDPGGSVSQFLARHGVKVEIDVLSKTLPRVSDVLMRHAVDMKADLMVMGGYGHSRFREAVFGGATRNLLEAATLPLFMAH